MGIIFDHAQFLLSAKHIMGGTSVAIEASSGTTQIYYSVVSPGFKGTLDFIQVDSIFEIPGGGSTFVYTWQYRSQGIASTVWTTMHTSQTVSTAQLGSDQVIFSFALAPTTPSNLAPFEMRLNLTKGSAASNIKFNSTGVAVRITGESTT